MYPHSPFTFPQSPLSVWFISHFLLWLSIIICVMTSNSFLWAWTGSLFLVFHTIPFLMMVVVMVTVMMCFV